MAIPMPAKRIPVPRPGTRFRKIQAAVLVRASWRYKMPIPRVVRNHPLHNAHRYRPVMLVRMPTMTDAGATVNVSGKRATPVRIGERSLTASK